MSQKKKLVVYTVLCGTKEPLNDKMIAPGSGGADRILFTDRDDLRSDLWQVRRFDTKDLEPDRASRRPKLLPHRYLSDYEWSLYFDNTVSLKLDPVELLADYAYRGPAFFSFPHPWRACAYDEAEALIQMGYDQERRIREQMDHYRKLGFPRGVGLIAGTMLLRRHDDPALIEVSEQWYEHVLRYSKRDQLSFNFVAWSRQFCYGRLAGGLEDNEYMSWPSMPNTERVTAAFDEDFYRWRYPETDEAGVSPREHYLAAKRAGKNPQARPYPWRLRQLANRYRSDKGDLYYNGHGYADVYEFLLRDRRNAKLKILEIGLLRHDVQARSQQTVYDDVPSLAMWREYFPKAELYGFDIADFSAAAPIPGVTVIQGDMSSEADLDRLLHTAGGGFDLIIDDGSHASHHQQFALAKLFPHLKAGGIYFIEDLHYQPPQWELPGIKKTASVLQDLAANLLSPTEYIDVEALKQIRQSASRIQFYDSGERVFGKILADALVAIVKRSPADGDPVAPSPRQRMKQWLLDRVNQMGT
ncbi:MAG: DUF616 domain-containing protein [Polyangia bacterium]|jgi:hypothetical protein|nr:DUF616 domain-containing protein [Polyangia bacterium]